MARTVHYAHEHGILHRDIKPGNILLDVKGEPHLTDFGLARLLESESTVTRTLEVLGTPSYMAAEQAAGNNTKLTSATDVYGLSAVLYQLLTGHPPFAGGTTYETVRLVLETEPRQPRLWNPKIDRDLSTICLKCLEKDPTRRYDSALALAEDLERWLRHEPIRARHSGVFTRGKKWVRRNRTTALLFALSLAFAATVGVMIWKSRPEPPPPAGVAVLPFVNMSADKENEYLGDGITEDLCTALSQIKGLRMPARTSSFMFKGKTADIRKIGKQLNVSTVLEGSVSKAGNKVRISAQLNNVADGYHLWAETYDRYMTDILEIRSDISKNVADALKVQLGVKETQLLAKKPTENAQAYETYLRAIALNNSQSDADNARMRDLFREAVELDPNFAEAWSWLAAMESVRYLLPEESPAQKERARSAAETALHLAPDSADAIGSMGLYYYYVEKNYDEALRWLDRARAIAPNVWKWINATSLVKRRQGKLDETIALQERAADLDPLNVSLWMDLAWSYRGQRDFEHERAILDRALTISPNDANIVAQKAETYAATGDLEKSWQMVRDLKFGPSDNGVGIALDIVIARRDYDEAIRRITAMRESGKEPPLFQAVDRAVVGQLKFTEGDSVAAEPLLHQAEGELTRLRDRHEAAS